MNKVIKESKKIKDIQPKLQNIFNEVDSYTNNYKTLEKQNQNMQREIKSLTTRNQNLKKENNNLKNYLSVILMAIKKFFRKLLQLGNEKTKELATEEIKDYYDNNDFNSDDIYDISKGTTKEDELFDYAEIPDYMKTTEKIKDDYDRGLSR